MERVLDFIGSHGLPAVFVIMFVCQISVAIPAPPFILAFGALAGSGRIDLVPSLLVALVASASADYVWFRLGRWRGSGILGFLCRAALEPDTCVSKTHDLFSRYGLKSLLVAKFVPGFDTVAPPIAGMLGVGTMRFVAWSATGALLWIAAYGALGYAFAGDIERLAAAADQLGSTLGVAIVSLVGAYFAWKYVGRQRVLRSIRMARITPEELHRMISTGEPPMIFDVRTRTALDVFPFMIAGAQLLTDGDIDTPQFEFPRQQDIVVYCSCPNEVSSARVALKLQRLGAKRVRPLAGGIEAWHERHFPVVPQ
jgi:membrane protein DedA with SNARE-associated domain/rhodanese-related sulfurtransferase